MLITFSQNPQKAFETAAQTTKELKGTEYDRMFCKKFKLIIDRYPVFFFIFLLNIEMFFIIHTCKGGCRQLW